MRLCEKEVSRRQLRMYYILLAEQGQHHPDKNQYNRELDIQDFAEFVHVMADLEAYMSTKLLISMRLDLSAISFGHNPRHRRPQRTQPPTPSQLHLVSTLDTVVDIWGHTGAIG
jgi:hypothetical protein